MKAPEFPADGEWIGVDEPLRLDALRGHIVLLDFWTYCCINCLHVLPVLKRLEEEFHAEPFVVIGVHAAKFEQEKDPENIRNAMRRHGVCHPCFVDNFHDLWRAYAVRAWPTLVLIDAAGEILEMISGEPGYDALRGKVRQALDAARERGGPGLVPKSAVRARPLQPPGPPQRTASSPLAFPGKVRVLRLDEDPRKRTLAVSDTGHHRILLCALEDDSGGWPRVTGARRVGSGVPGDLDGDFDSACFRRPQGVDGRNGVLYVCDTENHLLRKIDLAAETVTTLAGNGGSERRSGSLDPRLMTLRSPWDCQIINDDVLIAVAGSHQLWAYLPAKHQLFPAVGSGIEDHIDGPFQECALAQPSALFVFHQYCLLADSEISSIRILDFEKTEVRTVAGKGLFDFGDADGPVADVLLQHPLGVAYQDGQVYIADTFNNKIKKIDVSKQVCETFVAGDLYEPGGIDVDGDFLFVADTNRQRVLAVRISTREIRTLELKVDSER